MASRYGKATGYSCSCFSKTCDMSCNMYRLVENKPSNADRIRSMTDEELAEWFYFSSLGFHYNQEEMLNWLKQEAET